jgi:Fe-S-cluster containining protein
MARLPTFGPPPKPGDKARRDAIKALYASLPRLDCAGKCAESCGPVFMTRVEWQQICKRTRSEPSAGDGLTCPMLVEERCSVYEVRPMLCRLWGMVETMKCPWGCIPERYLTEKEGYELLQRAYEEGT